MPQSDSILLKTAKEEVSRIKKASFEINLWKSIARLYSAAVLQMSRKDPIPEKIQDFPDLSIIRNLPVNLSCSKTEVKEYLKIPQFIIKFHKSSKQDIMSDCACYVLQILGPPLYGRLRFILETYQFSEHPCLPSDLFRVEFNIALIKAKQSAANLSSTIF